MELISDLPKLDIASPTIRLSLNSLGSSNIVNCKTQKYHHPVSSFCLVASGALWAAELVTHSAVRLSSRR